MNKSMKALEFDKILELLCSYSISDSAGKKLLNLMPYRNEKEVNLKTKETTEAKKILEHIGTPPLSTMKDIPMMLELSEKGSMLLPEQLTGIGQFITACNRMKQFLKRAEYLEVNIASYGYSLDPLPHLSEEIERSIRNNSIDDNASKELRDIRRKMEQITAEIKSKLENLLRSKKEWFNDSYLSQRNGHFVLPVKKEYKHQVSGSVLDISSTGSTYFIEPTSSAKLREELSILEISESNEERRILYSLTSLVCDNASILRLNLEGMEALDFIFAKAKLSADMKAVAPVITGNRTIHIVNGRHPLINPSECVPLNFWMGEGVKGVVITGPNTGGKTVALKTVGLFQLMAQSGLHVPCDEAVLCMNNAVLCDIGDGQSISENLSTFSSHITNIIDILKNSDQDSLILLDELGSGTDPAEGMGIAIAILEELRQKGCLFLATTHYPEVKDYAYRSENLVNARMAFDRESLKPLYQLEIGEAGESCALYIAKRLGLSKRMLLRAYQEAYGKEKQVLTTVIDSEFIEEAIEDTPPINIARIERSKEEKQSSSRSRRFQIGDSVIVYPQKKVGIVYQEANERGEVGVQIQKKKGLYNHKRLQLKVAASEMYPENYDFSIIFDSVENRKARHKMEKGHQPDLTIVYQSNKE